MLVAFFSGVAISDEMTIKGTINESQQLMGDDGKVYDINEDGKGAELVEKIGEKVEVTGTVTENDGAFSIQVISFTVTE